MDTIWSSMLGPHFDGQIISLSPSAFSGLVIMVINQFSVYHHWTTTMSIASKKKSGQSPRCWRIPSHVWMTWIPMVFPKFSKFLGKSWEIWRSWLKNRRPHGVSQRLAPVVQPLSWPPPTPPASSSPERSFAKTRWKKLRILQENWWFHRDVGGISWELSGWWCLMGSKPQKNGDFMVIFPLVMTKSLLWNRWPMKIDDCCGFTY